MIICGVDPGAEGALALLDAETRRVIAIIDMPMSGPDLLVRELVTDIEGALDGRRVVSIFIERQAAFAGGERKIGATSAFNIGGRFWALRAIAACFGWPTEIVSPAKWQKHFGITKADKAKSLVLADELMPEDCGLWKPRRGYCTKAQAIGRCEAALISLFGIRSLAGVAATKPAPILPAMIAALQNDTLDDILDEDSSR